MLFGRGVWSIFGVHKSSLHAFNDALGNPEKLFTLSQLMASAQTKFGGNASFGINPFAKPRKDETKLSADLNEDVLAKEKLSEAELSVFTDGYGTQADEYLIGENTFGFWVVVNDFEDVTDPKSKQEGMAYDQTGRPFKFLNKEEKKAIEGNIKAQAVCSRLQFPVLVDFNAELVFVANGKAENVGIARDLLTALGAEPFSLAWQFDGYDWPGKFLNAVNDNMRPTYENAMRERADEFNRFQPDEIEKLDDKMMEGVVSTYFAMTELETGQWAGLSTPAQVKLYKSGAPVVAGAAHPSVAFSILAGFEDAKIASAAVVFQSLESRFKKEQEIQYRKDLFSMDVNDNINLTDAGAAMLRGFDLPGFKKHMKQAAKAGSLTIAEFWFTWLVLMKDAVRTFTDNVTETLYPAAQDRSKFGLRPYEHEAEAAGAE